MKWKQWIGIVIVLFAVGGCDTTFDPNCKDNEEYIDGECIVTSCPDGFELITGECVAITCEENEEWLDGKCTVTSCPLGFDLQEGECVPIVCDEGYRLENGECVLITCPEGYDVIAGECVLVSCPAGYKLEDGECVEIVLTPLEAAIKSLNEAENYALDVSIDLDFVRVTMELRFTDSISYANISGEETFWWKNGTLCMQTTNASGNWVEETIPCMEQNNVYDFHRDFEATWFYLEDGQYRLNLDRYGSLHQFFNTELPGAVVSNFVATIEGRMFDTFVFNVTANQKIYRFEMTYSSFGEVELTIPTTG